VVESESHIPLEIRGHGLAGVYSGRIGATPYMFELRFGVPVHSPQVVPLLYCLFQSR
jgi:hypothetical protein